VFQFLQLSSLEKVMLTGNRFPQQEFTHISGLKNETLSYQIAFQIDGSEEKSRAFLLSAMWILRSP